MSSRSTITVSAKALHSPSLASSQLRRLRPTSSRRASRWSGAEKNGLHGAPSRTGRCGAPAIPPPAKSSSRNDEHPATIHAPASHLPRDHVDPHSFGLRLSFRPHRVAVSHREVRRFLPLGINCLLVHRVLSRTPKTSHAGCHFACYHGRHRIPQAR